MTVSRINVEKKTGYMRAVVDGQYDLTNKTLIEQAITHTIPPTGESIPLLHILHSYAQLQLLSGPQVLLYECFWV